MKRESVCEEGGKGKGVESHSFSLTLSPSLEGVEKEGVEREKEE